MDMVTPWPEGNFRWYYQWICTVTAAYHILFIFKKFQILECLGFRFLGW